MSIDEAVATDQGHSAAEMGSQMVISYYVLSDHSAGCLGC